MLRKRRICRVSVADLPSSSSTGVNKSLHNIRGTVEACIHFLIAGSY